MLIPTCLCLLRLPSINNVRWRSQLRRLKAKSLLLEAIVAQQSVIEIALLRSGQVVGAGVGEGEGVGAVGGDRGAEGVAVERQYGQGI